MSNLHDFAVSFVRPGMHAKILAMNAPTREDSVEVDEQREGENAKFIAQRGNFR